MYTAIKIVINITFKLTDNVHTSRAKQCFISMNYYEPTRACTHHRLLGVKDEVFTEDKCLEFFFFFFFLGRESSRVLDVFVEGGWGLFQMWGPKWRLERQPCVFDMRRLKRRAEIEENTNDTIVPQKWPSQKRSRRDVVNSRTRERPMTQRHKKKAHKFIFCQLSLKPSNLKACTILQTFQDQRSRGHLYTVIIWLHGGKNSEVDVMCVALWGWPTSPSNTFRRRQM